MPAARVTRLTESDWEQLAHLRLSALSDVFGTADPQYRLEVDFTPADWRRRLREHAYFGAFLDQQLVGLIAAYQQNPETAYLYSLWIDPAARGAGLGRPLVGAVVAWAGRHAVQIVTLRMDRGNHAARRIYENAGFVEVPSGRSAGEVVMRLTIT
ncbi:GNAT family N-acetyltransferase [Mycolicibacterium sp. CBM1]